MVQMFHVEPLVVHGLGVYRCILWLLCLLDALSLTCLVTGSGVSGTLHRSCHPAMHGMLPRMALGHKMSASATADAFASFFTSLCRAPNSPDLLCAFVSLR
jgi:hypothetical protein